MAGDQVTGSSMHPTYSTVSQPTDAPAEDAGNQKGKKRGLQSPQSTKTVSNMGEGLHAMWSPFKGGTLSPSPPPLLLPGHVCATLADSPFVMTLMERPRFSWQLYIPCYFQTRLVCPHHMGFLQLWYELLPSGGQKPKTKMWWATHHPEAHGEETSCIFISSGCFPVAVLGVCSSLLRLCLYTVLPPMGLCLNSLFL